jgi:Zn-dependent M28 family amino/carboxypeptidase
MQTIHLLQTLHLHPRRTVRFIAWMDEEHNGSGSATYAQEHAAEMLNHTGALESDLGAGHPAGITYSGVPELDKWLSPISRVLAPIGAVTRSGGGDTGEDISPLAQAHVPTFTPTQDSRFYFNYHHTAADTFDKVHPQELNENAAVMTVLAYALAASEQPAPR